MKNMKSIKILALILVLGLFSFSDVPNRNQAAASDRLSALTWKAQTVEVGEIPQGTPKKIEFEFKNISNKAVLILNVSGSCGCTATDFTKTPVEPGKIGKISATYNAANLGSFSKTISVTINNAEISTILTLKGTVVATKINTEKS